MPDVTTNSPIALLPSFPTQKFLGCGDYLFRAEPELSLEFLEWSRGSD
jgi:hypothetical protein